MDSTSLNVAKQFILSCSLEGTGSTDPLQCDSILKHSLGADLTRKQKLLENKIEVNSTLLETCNR